MKNIKKLYFVFFTILLGFSCQEDEPDLVVLLPPSNLEISFNLVGADTDNPYGDGSGVVEVTASAVNALSYGFSIDGVLESSTSGKYTYSRGFSMPGELNTFELTVLAYGSGGISTSTFAETQVLYNYEPPAELLEKLIGDGSRMWRIKAEANAHFGLGPIGGAIPAEYYGASPNEKSGVGMYDDRYVFNADGTFTHITSIDTEDMTGSVFGRENLIEELDGPKETEMQGADVLNYPYSDYMVNWSVTAPEGKETINLTGVGFFGYYIGGGHTYEIFDRSKPNELLIRSADGNIEFDWWFIITSEEPEEMDDSGTVFTNLVWQDEFDVDGAPDPANWTYDLGAGGWGNNEAQTYTDFAENVIVEDGSLKINAVAKQGGGTFYFDELNLTDAMGNPQMGIEDFEAAAPAFENFGGASGQVIANPDVTGSNTTANVVEFSKPDGAMTWGGTFFNLGTPLDLSVNKKLSLQSWSPRAGVTVRLKLENSANTAEFHEVDAITSTANTWEELSFDLNDAPAFTYDRIVLFYDFGVVGGTYYTSSRIKSENLYEFTYGRVEIRAKLPSAGGTWPALWTLGANFDEVSWPASGEMDIMEHVGNNPNVVSSALHYPENSGGNAITNGITIATATSEFHNYSMEWTDESIKFFVDDEMVHLEFANSAETPFNNDFFFIMNIAMGGTLGGDIDPMFMQDTMEVDYIRVYQ